MTATFRHSDELWDMVPSLAVGAIVVEAVTTRPDVSDVVSRHVGAAVERLAETPESSLAAITAWRRVYARLGVRPTRHRGAAESLLRRLRTHGALPRVHPLVDLCNAVSVRYAVPVAVIDLDRVTGDLTVRHATGAERYQTFAGDVEHPAAGEVIYADSAGNAHSRRWVTRQSGLSAVRRQTTRALIVAEAVHDEAAADVDRLLDVLAETVQRHWRTPVRRAVLTAGSPGLALD